MVRSPTRALPCILTSSRTQHSGWVPPAQVLKPENHFRPANYSKFLQVVTGCTGLTNPQFPAYDVICTDVTCVAILMSNTYRYTPCKRADQSTALALWPLRPLFTPVQTSPAAADLPAAAAAMRPLQEVAFHLALNHP